MAVHNISGLEDYYGRSYDTGSDNSASNILDARTGEDTYQARARESLETQELDVREVDLCSTAILKTAL